MLRWFKRKESEPSETSEDLTKREPTEEPREPCSPLGFTTEAPFKGAWLEVTTREGQPLYLPLSRSPLLLGTAPHCDVVLDDRLDGVEKVLPNHARLELWRGRWVIVPMSKEAAVFVNGRRTGENVLRDGMEVWLGEKGVRFIFRSPHRE